MTDNKNNTSRREFMAAGLGMAALAGIGFNRLATAQEAVNPVTVIVSFRIQPGKEEAAIALLNEMTAAVKETEPGALAYVAHRDAADPMKVTFFEIYSDQEAVNAHRNGPALQAALPKFGEIFAAGAPEVTNLNRVAGFTRET